MNSPLLAAFLRQRRALFWWRLFLVLAAAAFSLLLILQTPPWQVLTDASGTEEGMNLSRIVMFWTWWAGAGGMAIMGALFLLCPWWVRAPQPVAVHTEAPALAPHWFWPLVFGAVLACGAISAPALSHSLWDDENESVSWYTVGRYVRHGDEADHLRFKRCAWQKTIFAFTTPNNHVFHNILSRACNELWRTAAQPGGLQFDPLAVRLPAFLAALASAMAVAALLAEFGFYAGGVAAAWFLAVHPWFTEHAASARGYTLAMFLAALAVTAWRRALRTAAWLWWVCFAAAQFLLLWTYIGSLFLLVPLNLAAILLIALRPADVAGPRRTQLSRWFCVSCLAAAGLLPLLLPITMQFRDFLARLFEAVIGADWLRDTFWFFVAGAPWARGSTPEWTYPDMQIIAGALGPGAVAVLAMLVAGLFLLGCVRFARSGWLAFALTLAVLAAPCLHFFYVRARKIFIFEWYVIYALPFVAIFWGVGAVTLSGWLTRAFKCPQVRPAVTGLLIAAYAFLVHPVHAWQTVHPKTPHRESVLATRSNPGKYRSSENRRIITACVGSSPALAYDPRLLLFDEPAELMLLCQHADWSGCTLAVNIGHMANVQRDHSRELALLQDRRLFGRAEFFGGADPVWNRCVFFYTPGSAAEFDFTAVLNPEELAFVEANRHKNPAGVLGRSKRKKS